MDIGILTVQAREGGFTGQERLSYAGWRRLYNNESSGYVYFSEASIDLLFQEMVDVNVVVGFNLIDYGYTLLQKYAESESAALVLHEDIPTFDFFDAIKQQHSVRIKFNSLATSIGQERLAEGLEFVALWQSGGATDLELKEAIQRDCDILSEAYLHCIENESLVILPPPNTTYNSLVVDTTGWQTLIPVIGERTQVQAPAPAESQPRIVLQRQSRTESFRSHEIPF